jgi:uncharacterized protein (TIGR00288 family)
MAMHRQRVAILIDGENLEIHPERAYGRRVDYRQLIAAMSHRDIVRAIYYKPADRMTNGLMRFLEREGVEVRVTPKNSDTFLAVDAIALGERCDVIALVGGDVDYVPVMYHLRSRGVRTEVWCWEQTTSHALKEAADLYVRLGADFLLGSNPASTGAVSAETALAATQ